MQNIPFNQYLTFFLGKIKRLLIRLIEIWFIIEHYDVIWWF